MAKLRKNT